MKVRVVVGFVDRKQFTRVKGALAEFDDAYTAELIEQGKVEMLDDQAVASKAKSSKRKASKKNARENL
jgi:hypothetical protein